MKRPAKERIRFIICGCLSFFFFQSISAQFCTGSLGDPVVKIDFANSNGSFAPTNYTYTTSTCPNDGSYTITNNTSGCFGNAWHTVNADHTGTGGFMLVNASYQPSDFFVSTVSGLCPNTTYEFSAWIMNVLVSPSGIKPNLTFTIETVTGTVLDSLSTGDIPVSAQPTWLPYGFYFTTTANLNSVTIRIKNNAPGGGGNDLALDDISFRPCGPLVKSSIAGLGDTVKVCVDKQITYLFNGQVSSGFINPAYQWQVSRNNGVSWTDIPGANSLNYNRQQTSAGVFLYRLASAESSNASVTACRVNSNFLRIEVEPKPQINAGPDRALINGHSTKIAASAGQQGLNFIWSPTAGLSSALILNPDASPNTDTRYILTAISPLGCMNTDDLLVKVIPGIFIPTAFTPNNDGKNDHWRIPYLDLIGGFEIMVFNRWGGRIYYSTQTADWDGNYKGIPQSSGTYIFYIHFTDGSADQKGFVQLIR